MPSSWSAGSVISFMVPNMKSAVATGLVNLCFGNCISAMLSNSKVLVPSVKSKTAALWVTSRMMWGGILRVVGVETAWIRTRFILASSEMRPPSCDVGSIKYGCLLDRSKDEEIESIMSFQASRSTTGDAVAKTCLRPKRCGS